MINVNIHRTPGPHNPIMVLEPKLYERICDFPLGKTLSRVVKYFTMNMWISYEV